MGEHGMIRNIFNKSVFRPIERGSSMDSILATLFHRGSATLYLMSTLWGVAFLLSGRNFPDLWSLFLPVAVIVAAPIACLGATFWPIFARLEMVAGSSFVGLVVVYTLFTTWRAIVGFTPWSGVFVLLAMLVFPVARVAVICVFLLRQVRESKGE